MVNYFHLGLDTAPVLISKGLEAVLQESVRFMVLLCEVEVVATGIEDDSCEPDLVDPFMDRRWVKGEERSGVIRDDTVVVGGDRCGADFGRGITIGFNFVDDDDDRS